MSNAPDIACVLPGEDPRVTRWTIARKAEVIRRVSSCRLTMADACERYGFSLEELRAWQDRAERYGARGLAQTRIQEARR